MSEDSRYPQIVRAVRETPWAILPGTLATILDIVGHRVAGERFSEEEIRARVGTRAATKPSNQYGSVAVIPIYGAIVPKATLFSDMSGGTSIQSLRDDFRAATNDDSVRAIVFDVDSPGGMTDMVPEFAAELRAARGQKPMVAVSNTRMASAAYWLGSQADEIVITPSGDAGSIGVFGVHEDVSAMNEKLGVKPTLISAGKYKVEGNAYEPLTDDARSAMQERVDEMYDTFVSDVAKGRRVTAEAVKAGYGEGRMLSATRALKDGMVDRVDTLENVVSKLQNPAGRTRVANGNAAGSNVSYTFAVTPPLAGPLPPHETATSDATWDGAANKARLRNDGGEAYFKSAFAWQDDQADPETKVAYKFIHHEVNADGDVGAANLTACSQGIAVLNGGRTGTTIPDADRKGVWNHLAKHLRDAGREPPPLQGLDDDGHTFSDAVDEAHRAFDTVVSGGEALRALTARKRDQLAALIERGTELLARTDSANGPEPGDGLEIELAFSEVDARLRGLYATQKEES